MKENVQAKNYQSRLTERTGIRSDSFYSFSPLRCINSSLQISHKLKIEERRFDWTFGTLSQMQSLEIPIAVVGYGVHYTVQNFPFSIYMIVVMMNQLKETSIFYIIFIFRTHFFVTRKKDFFSSITCSYLVQLVYFSVSHSIRFSGLIKTAWFARANKTTIVYWSIMFHV